MRRWSAKAAIVFAIAVAINYPWELAQSPLYVGQDELRSLLWHCLRAALGDGVLVLLILLAGIFLTRRPDWYRQPGRAGYLWMLSAGLGVGITIEWLAVHVAGRWAYAPAMPVVLLLEIGLVPVLQMLLLPPLIFRLASLAEEWQAARKRSRVS